MTKRMLKIENAAINPKYIAPSFQRMPTKDDRTDDGMRSRQSNAAKDANRKVTSSKKIDMMYGMIHRLVALLTRKLHMSSAFISGVGLDVSTPSDMMSLYTTNMHGASEPIHVATSRRLTNLLCCHKTQVRCTSIVSDATIVMSLRLVIAFPKVRVVQGSVPAIALAKPQYRAVR